MPKRSLCYLAGIIELDLWTKFNNRYFYLILAIFIALPYYKALQLDSSGHVRVAVSPDRMIGVDGTTSAIVVSAYPMRIQRRYDGAGATVYGAVKVKQCERAQKQFRGSATYAVESQ